MSKHAKVHGVLGQPRALQEAFLRNRGWDRLVERADIWIDLKAEPRSRHDVYLFRFALEKAVARHYHLQKAAAAREAAIHRNPAAEAPAWPAEVEEART